MFRVSVVVCPEITAPENGTVSCINDTDGLNCTLNCNVGFAFDIEPLDSYFCGQETFHIWNYETDINPLRRLPGCVGKQILHINNFSRPRYD